MKRVMFALASIGLLSGCGIPGGLDRPDPMWNSEEVIRRECERAAARGERLDERCNPPTQTQTRNPNAPYIDDTARVPAPAVPPPVVQSPHQ